MITVAGDRQLWLTNGLSKWRWIGYLLIGIDSAMQETVVRIINENKKEDRW